jgi:hypothetical protein
MDASKERRISYLCLVLNPGYSSLTPSHCTDRAITSVLAKHVIGMYGRHKKIIIQLAEKKSLGRQAYKEGVTMVDCKERVWEWTGLILFRL